MPSITNKDKHYLRYRPEYPVWAAMKQRCLNSNNKSFHHYGGRGIEISEAWLDFKNFINDMGFRPTPKHSLDRIDNDGNYEPSNCRWATKTMQELNKRKSPKNTSGYTGITRYNNVWKAIISINNKNIKLGSFDNLADAIKARKKAVKFYSHSNS